MGYLLKLIYVMAILVPTINSSEALSSMFNTDVLTHYKTQQASMIAGHEFMISETDMMAMIKAQPHYFTQTSHMSNTYNDGAAYACAKMQLMTNASLDEGRVMEAKALNFYHGLVKQAAKHNGYDKC